MKKSLKLFKIFQTVNNNYDTYDSAIVCAENEDEARKINPDGQGQTHEEPERFSSWCGLKDVQIQYIGEADKSIEKGVIIASFNAG